MKSKQKTNSNDLNESRNIIIEPNVPELEVLKSNPFSLRVKNTNDVVSKVALFGEGIYKGFPNNGSDEGIKIQIQNGHVKYESLCYFVSLNPSKIRAIRLSGNIKNIREDFINLVTFDFQRSMIMKNILRPYLYKDTYQFQNDILDIKKTIELSAFQGVEFDMMPNCELQFAFYPSEIQLLKKNI